MSILQKDIEELKTHFELQGYEISVQRNLPMLQATDIFDIYINSIKYPEPINIHDIHDPIKYPKTRKKLRG